MTLSPLTFNQTVNPYFPFLFITPSLLTDNPLELEHNQEEELLFAAHIKFSSSKPGLLVASNQRVIMYHFKESLLKRAVKFGIDELKGEIMGNIPVFSDILAVKDKLSEWNQQYKDANKDWNEEARQKIRRFAEMMAVPPEDLLHNKEGWSVQSEFDFSSLAKALSKLELFGEKLYLDWDLKQSQHIPNGLNFSTPKLFSDYALPGLWALSLHLKPLIEKYGFTVVNSDRGLFIQKSEKVKAKGPEATDFSPYMAMDPFNTFADEFIYQRTMEAPWDMSHDPNAAALQEQLDPRAKILENFNAYFPPNIGYRWQDTNWRWQLFQ